MKTMIFIQMLLKVDGSGPTNNKFRYVPVMAWHQTGDEPLSELIIAYFMYTYMRHTNDFFRVNEYNILSLHIDIIAYTSHFFHALKSPRRCLEPISLGSLDGLSMCWKWAGWPGKKPPRKLCT